MEHDRLYEIAQIVAVAVILVICVAWIVNRIRHRNDYQSCDNGCDGCGLAKHCKGKKRKQDN